jgi:hypothetical protein
MNSFFRTAAVALLLVSLLLVTLDAGAITVDQSQPAAQPKTWQQATTVEKIQFVCGVSAVVFFFVAEVWFIVAGFKASVGWGLFMLFIGGFRSIFAILALLSWLVWWATMLQAKQAIQLPMIIGGIFLLFMGGGAILFVTRHWDVARGPFKTMMLGIVLIAVVVGLQLSK